MSKLIAALALLVLTGGFAVAAGTSAEVVLSLPQDAELRTVDYLCPPLDEASPDDPLALSVRYIDAHPDFLAILPVEEESRIFVRVSSADDVIYASGDYLWQTDGVDAQLTSLSAGPEADPILSCYEAGDIP